MKRGATEMTPPKIGIRTPTGEREIRGYKRIGQFNTMI